MQRHARLSIEQSYHKVQLISGLLHHFQTIWVVLNQHEKGGSPLKSSLAPSNLNHAGVARQQDEGLGVAGIEAGAWIDHLDIDQCLADE